MFAALMALCWFALGCGLVGGDQPETAPPSEPGARSTIDVVVGGTEATRQAGAPTATDELEPTATVAPTVAATPMAGRSAGVPSELDWDARWSDVFPAITEAEQHCIRDEMGEAELAVALQEWFFRDYGVQELESAMLGCLSQETAAALFNGLFITRMIAPAQLTEESEACIQGLVADDDALASLATMTPDAAPGPNDAIFEFFMGLESCDPETAAGPAMQHETALWRFTTEGWVSSALTVADGVVYVGSNDNHLYALDAATGALLGSYDTGVPVRHSPVVVGDRPYASTLVNGEV